MSSGSRPLGYPSDETPSSSSYYCPNMDSNARTYSYSRFGNDVSDQEIRLDHGEFSRPYTIRWKSGKRVDQRLLTLLESYSQELYVKHNELFKKIFPDDEFAHVFKKIGIMSRKIKNNQRKYQTMQRSLSFGSPRSSEIRLERFRVKTPSVVVAQPGGGNGGTTSTVSSPPPK